MIFRKTPQRGTPFDLTGVQYGKLTIKGQIGQNKWGQNRWAFVCDCGKTGVITGSQLKRPNGTKSCGCLRREVTTAKNLTHGKTGTVGYALWESAKRRAKKQGVEFNIHPNDITVPEFCPLLGVKLFSSKKRLNPETSPSLDRINPKLGYVTGNIWVISYRANAIKNNATFEELQKVVDGLRKKIEETL